MSREPDTIPVNCVIPDSLVSMMDDFKTMTNHMIQFGLFKKVGLEAHYYPLAEGDDSGKPKPIPADRELRDLVKPWFLKNYDGKYAVHYLDSAASFAQQHISSWRELGGDITALPHVEKPIARLNNDLWKILEARPDGTMKIRITLAPYKYETMDIKVNHRHFREWSQNKKGALVIVPYGLRFCFTDDSDYPPKPKESVVLDTNFERLVAARSDGEFLQTDMSDVSQIQINHLRKRKSVQKTMAHNPDKLARLLESHTGREHNRVEDLLHKKLHGKNSHFKAFVGNRRVGIEDLRSINKNVLKKDRGKKFNGRMSRWIHGMLNDIIAHHFDHVKEYYTRGTSDFCPFDNTKLVNPNNVWKQLYCKTCRRIYDRDWLESVNGLVRFNSRHKKGETWATAKDVFPQAVVRKLKRNIMVAPFSVPSRPARIQGLSPTARPESVHPEWAVLYPEGQNVLGVGLRTDVRLGNRVKDWPQVAKSSGNDAKISSGVPSARLST
jgi:hypothetical protein